MSILRLSQVEQFAQTYSDDLKVKVGACIEVGESAYFGTNRFLAIPDGHTKQELQENRELKLKYITHAERDALRQLDDQAVGATIYVNYTPCIDCAQAIALSGIKKVVVKSCDDAAVRSRWQDSWNQAISLLEDKGVEYTEV